MSLQLLIEGIMLPEMLTSLFDSVEKEQSDLGPHCLPPH